MSLYWSIHSEHRLVSVVAEGDVTRSDVEELLDAMASQNAMSYRKLFDGTKGTTIMGPDNMRELGVRMRGYHARSRTASG